MTFTKEEKQKAKRTDLIQFCTNYDYDLKDDGSGNYKVRDYAGVIIKENYFFNHTSQEKGSAIDFCVNVIGMSFKEAVEKLLACNCTVDPAEEPDHSDDTWKGGERLRRSPAEQEKKYVCLPERVDPSALFSYLCKVRRLPMKTIKKFIASGLLYQDANHNCVFPCYDVDHHVRGTIIRGTQPERAFKGRATGSDMKYGWHVPTAEYSNTVTVFEAPIDAMSYTVLYPDVTENQHLLAMGGLQLEAIKGFLHENKQISRIVLALDNDEPATKFTENVIDTLGHIYHMEKIACPIAYKDWNEALVQERRK